MKTLLVISISIFGFCLTKAQNIISVNNNDPGMIYEYTDLQEAVDAAVAGDVIYVYPSIQGYGNVNVNKSITIRGPGYNIIDNTSLNVNTILQNSEMGTININANTNNVTVEGCVLDKIYIRGSSDIVVLRNLIKKEMHIDSSANILINANFFSGEIFAGAFNYILEVRNNSSEILVTSNIFDEVSGDVQWCCGDAQPDNYICDASSSSYVYNNVFRDGVNMNNTIFVNNIHLYDKSSSPIINNNSIIQHNVFVLSPSVDTTNLLNVDVNSICVGYKPLNGYSFDSRFQLKAGSPALGAAEDGGDCGVFNDGPGAYKLSGLPGIPVITDFYAPVIGAQNDSLSIELKARSEN